jgi:hypothetical protein
MGFGVAGSDTEETSRLERVKKSKFGFSGLKKNTKPSEIIAHIARYCVFLEPPKSSVRQPIFSHVLVPGFP